MKPNYLGLWNHSRHLHVLGFLGRRGGPANPHFLRFSSHNLPLSPIFKCENLRALILREKFANKRVTQLGGLSSRVKFPSSWLWVELVPAWLKAQKFGPAHLICSIQGPLEMQQWKSWIPGAVANRDLLFAFLPRTTLGTWKIRHQRCSPPLYPLGEFNFFFSSFPLSW